MKSQKTPLPQGLSSTTPFTVDTHGVDATKKSDSEDSDKIMKNPKGLVLDFDRDASKIEDKLRKVSIEWKLKNSLIRKF